MTAFQFAHLKGLNQLSELHLDFTIISDSDLAKLKALTRYERQETLRPLDFRDSGPLQPKAKIIASAVIHGIRPAFGKLMIRTKENREKPQVLDR